MKGKALLSGVLVLAVVGIGLTILFSEHQKNESNQEIQEVKVESRSQLHPDILRLIASGTETVAGITPDMAQTELENRGGSEVEFNKGTADMKTLPFEVVKAIAKSPATIAGITPKEATREVVRRYLAIDLTDSDDVDSAIVLEALQHKGEQEAIDQWAANEDAEAVDAFLKEEADRDPESIANFAYGFKHLDQDHDLGLSYMDRYATHHQSDAFDNPSAEKAYNELNDTIKKLK